MGSPLSNRFDTRKPILTNLVEFASSNGGKISNAIFSQACQEHKLDEDAVMEQMASSADHNFARTDDGWQVSAKESAPTAEKVAEEHSAAQPAA